MGARETALNVLIACRRDSAWSNGVLKEYLTRDHLEGREAALATRLCYGVLQNRLRLDFYLKQLLSGRSEKLHPVIHDILHLGLYQIYDLERIPDSAAVNESVALARKYCPKQKYASGLVNGVLRSAVRTKGTLREPTSLEDRYSHPWPLIALLRESIGKDRIETMLRANNSVPETMIQVNTRKITTEALERQLISRGVQVNRHGWMTDCLVLGGTGAMEKLPEFRDGLFYVQDPAAKLAVLCADIHENDRVLDCCAAPGGKSFAASMLLRSGSITSCDIHPHKVSLIESGARRLGIVFLQARLQNAAEFVPEWEGKMNVVLADVPCSGYGIIRKKPDIRYKRPEDMEQLPGLQSEILENQSRYVAPGGVLLYSTCTLLRRENEDIVKSFLENHPEFKAEKPVLPEEFPQFTDPWLTLVPGEYDTDGFFICRLRRSL